MRQIIEGIRERGLSVLLDDFLGAVALVVLLVMALWCAAPFTTHSPF